VLPIVGLLTTLLVAAPASEASVKAYIAAWRGDLPEARAHAAAALAKDPGDGAALFVTACVEIEEGHFPAAGALAAKLAAVDPRPPEAEVIRLLAERRRSRPSERMEESLSAAWKAAGRPDVGKAGLVQQLREGVPEGVTVLPPLDPIEVSKRPAADVILLSQLVAPLLREWKDQRPANDVLEAHVKWMGAQAAKALALPGAPDSNSVALNACVLRWLDDPEGRQRIKAALALAMPDNGLPGLAVALDGTVDAASLTGPELDAIAAATSQSKFGWPYRAINAEHARAVRPLDSAHAELLARELTGRCGPISLVPITLAHRAEATRDPALRIRASAVTEAVGRRMAESGTLLDVMIGYVLKRSAAKQRGDLEREAKDENAEKWRVKLTTASSAAAVYSWPLASLWRQWDPEREVQFLSLLADAPMPP
jgi:hypothetical protein